MTDVEAEAEPDAWRVQMGAMLPDWLRVAMEAGAVVPLPEPAVGDLWWGQEGVELRSSGEREKVPMGDWVVRDADGVLRREAADWRP